MHVLTEILECLQCFRSLPMIAICSSSIVFLVLQHCHPFVSVHAENPRVVSCDCIPPSRCFSLASLLPFDASLMTSKVNVSNKEFDVRRRVHT